MCLSIDISQSEEKEFNIDNSSQRSSEGFNFSIETFGRGIGTSIDKEINPNCPLASSGRKIELEIG